jgi:hypothetical protein
MYAYVKNSSTPLVEFLPSSTWPAGASVKPVTPQQQHHRTMGKRPARDLPRAITDTVRRGRWTRVGRARTAKRAKFDLTDRADYARAGAAKNKRLLVVAHPRTKRRGLGRDFRVWTFTTMTSSANNRCACEIPISRERFGVLRAEDVARASWAPSCTRLRSRGKLATVSSRSLTSQCSLRFVLLSSVYSPLRE